MKSSGQMEQSAKADFQTLLNLIRNRIPFTFIRFSDGEMEVIFDTRLIIGDGSVEWRGGNNPAHYPVFDRKSFVPERDKDFRADLLESASFQGPNYFKGIRTRGSLASRDKAKMLELNGGDTIGLSFTDLLINENWGAFKRDMVPLILARENVTFFGNFRAKPKLLSRDLGHIAIGDDFIASYTETLERAMDDLLTLPLNSLIISSASSLTNIVGHKLYRARPDLTLIDVGTALNPFIGLGDGLREYHSQLLPWTPRNLKKKALYYLFGSHRMKW